MKALYPDKAERLRQIFEKQVYGLAPTEIQTSGCSEVCKRGEAGAEAKRIV